jgi:hypothetical protein
MIARSLPKVNRLGKPVTLSDMSSAAQIEQGDRTAAE